MEKNIISIAKNIHVQKRLLLCNLRELYFSFKQEFPEEKVKFSMFCFLRPKWCVLAGSLGTHSICVCKIHQNTILLLHAAFIKDSYQELIKQLVCTTDNRSCKLRHCTSCPYSDHLQKYLEGKFEDYDQTGEILYQQWISTDRIEMVTCIVTLDEYVATLLKSLEKLHSFITKAQSGKKSKTLCT